jgi:L-asparaginase
MFYSLVIVLILAEAVGALKHQIQKREDPNTGLTWIYKDPSLPKVMSVGPIAHRTRVSR